jgi:hypothetical protein
MRRAERSRARDVVDQVQGGRGGRGTGGRWRLVEET